MLDIKRSAAFLTAVSLCLSLAGCGENSSSETNVSGTDSETVKTQTVRKELNEEQKKAASEAGISEDRYCTDNEAITKTASEIVDIYYKGISDADFDRCFEAFPDFYRKAMEDENREYNETNEQYMKGIVDSYAGNFGDDFYVFPEITSVLQISDQSLSDLEARIKDTFDTEITLDDLYYVYFKEVKRGSLKKESSPLEFCLLYTDGRYYLYDDYFENK